MKTVAFGEPTLQAPFRGGFFVNRRPSGRPCGDGRRFALILKALAQSPPLLRLPLFQTRVPFHQSQPSWFGPFLSPNPLETWEIRVNAPYRVNRTQPFAHPESNPPGPEAQAKPIQESSRQWLFIGRSAFRPSMTNLRRVTV